ncbi:IS481 family transposase, partial [Rhizobium ruizarguesonis]|uniref:IS481 family transposase n=1 Tax=Rhizobium ruizarguesonis TaxID=2081791 RepID=UPI0010326139
MNIHKNARLTPLRREEMALAVAKGQVSKAQAARLYGVSSKSVSRWVERFRAQGRAGMADRSSRPKISPRQTGQSLAERIVALRRQRLTGKHIAMETGVSPATVSRVLRRAGLSRMKDVDPAEPIVRYEYAEPGGLIHLDIKRLGRFHRVGHRITGDRTGQSNSRGVGWEYVHICIDDASRIAFTDIFPDETAVSAIAFLKAAVTYYQSLGITVTRVMTDNGACYKAKDFATTCKALGLKHIRTKPYTPKTNGKAER